MKYVVVLGDGMADEPITELRGKTPLSFAKTPNMDELAVRAEIGMVRTVPEGMAPGSDTANLSVLGYDPKVYYSGRSPLEALSIGVPMKDTDVALRCNIVTISEDDVPFENKTIIDHSSDEISTEDCTVLLNAVKEQLLIDAIAEAEQLAIEDADIEAVAERLNLDVETLKSSYGEEQTNEYAMFFKVVDLIKDNAVVK